MSELAPDHWQTLQGPANWYRLHHPPSWSVDERQGVQALRPPDSEAMIAVNTIWWEEQPAVDGLPGLAQIAAQFPQVREVARVNEEPLDGLTECMSGEAVLNSGKGWWSRLFSSHEWRAWRMWAFRRDKLLVVVTLLHGGPRDPELEAVTRMALRSLELAQQPAEPPEVFAHRVLRTARQHFPLLDIQLGEGFQMRVAGAVLKLHSLYRAYLREPDRFERIVLPAVTTVVQFTGWGAEAISPPLDIVRERLMVMLYPEQLWREQLDSCVGEAWVGGLAKLYVISEGHANWFVREDLLAKWGLTVDELHEIAVENLRGHFADHPMEIAVATDELERPSMLMPGQPGPYNCVRFLCPTFLSQLRDFAGGDLAVGMPNREFFVAVSLHRPQAVRDIRHQVSTDYQYADQPLTDRLLLITADGVSELIDEGE